MGATAEKPESVAPALELHPLEQKLAQTLRSGHTALPVLPHVATLALRLASDPNASVTELARLVDGDPPIAARFLSVANSVAYYRGWAASNTQAAIMRLGLAATRDLLFQVVYAASTQGLKRYQGEVQASFARSVVAGIACRNVCREIAVHYEYDYMCGLLHDIGEARVYRILASQPKPKEGMPLVEELVQRYHATAGAEVARAWKLPGDIVDVCAAHHDEKAQESFPVRLTMVADLCVAAVEATRKGVPGPDLAKFEKLGLEEQQINRILAKLREPTAPQSL
ncbi:MAG TPA: HDOD domain-containing protein [Polyangiaceae bacterium]|jgi:putative nucleotidyltransferase with HDIG domain|nr:HDOD domain-containing protein [Polyangiaceae bacterium]